MDWLRLEQNCVLFSYYLRTELSQNYIFIKKVSGIAFIIFWNIHSLNIITAVCNQEISP